MATFRTWCLILGATGLLGAAVQEEVLQLQLTHKPEQHSAQGAYLALNNDSTFWDLINNGSTSPPTGAEPGNPTSPAAEDPPNKTLTCETRSTHPNRFMTGAAYLDRHHANCWYGSESRMMQGFQLKVSKPTMQLEYECCKTAQPIPHSECRNFNTGWNAEGSGGSVWSPIEGLTTYLDRHMVMCPVNMALTMWHLVRNKPDFWGTKKLRINYECCAPPVGNSIDQGCTSGETDFVEDGGGSLEQLKDVHVRCEDTMVLTFWKLARNREHDKIKFIYSCCPVTEKSKGDDVEEEDMTNSTAGGNKEEEDMTNSTAEDRFVNEPMSSPSLA